MEIFSKHTCLIPVNHQLIRNVVFLYNFVNTIHVWFFSKSAGKCLTPLVAFQFLFQKFKRSRIDLAHSRESSKLPPYSGNNVFCLLNTTLCRHFEQCYY